MDEHGPDLRARIAKVLALDPSAPALEFERRWYHWGDLAATADAIEPLVAPGERVAVLLRNRPAHVGLLLGLLRSGACVVTANPERGADRVRADLESLDIGTIAGAGADFAAFAPPRRWLVSDALGFVDTSGAVPAKFGEPRPGVSVEMLTSGTTGPPKRVPLTYDTLSRVLAGAKYYERSADADVRLRPGITIVNSPLVHLGGLFRILQCVNDGRSFCLLERFRVDEWADAVRRHRPRTVSLVPAALRMVLDADLDPADLESIRSVVSGTAPLAPDDADAFRAKYGAPVLISYAATEFGGSVAGWNIDDHEQFWATKRGSVGRAHPGSELRVVDPDTGSPIDADEEGLLEVKTRLLGDDASWTRTTDLARIDADGFVFILGRADQAIIRGGFKVRPEDVRAALGTRPTGARRGRHRPARCAPRRGAGGGRRTATGPRAGLGRRPARGRVECARALRAAGRTEARGRFAAHAVGQGRSRRGAGAVLGGSVTKPNPRWTFGVEPLPEVAAVAPLLRRVAGLLQALEHADPAVAQLADDLHAAERALANLVSDDPRPRIGVDGPADRRPYVDHSRDVGAYNPCFPEYEITVDGMRAFGTVMFPLAFEGPPGVVHGGVLATFFDCVVQHHNCDVGVAGKTTSLLLEYRRPTPLGVRLRFEIDRVTDDLRITSRGRLFRADDILCAATMEAVAGDRANLPPVSPRRHAREWEP